MKLELYNKAVLRRDFPERGLQNGDMVVLVEHLKAPDGTEGYAVEVFNALGDTLDVFSVDAVDLEPLSEDEIPCVRRLAS